MDQPFKASGKEIKLLERLSIPNRMGKSTKVCFLLMIG